MSNKREKSSPSNEFISVHGAMRKTVGLSHGRIGIYAGAFDPVHAGHIAFALQALLDARLDEVIFLPERRPRYKPGVEHYGHRIAMLKSALLPHPDLAVMEMVDKHFTVRRTWPQLQAALPNTSMVLLMGSDTAASVPDWPGAGRLLEACELVVGVRGQHQPQAVLQELRAWTVAPKALTVIGSFAAGVSSAQVRQALRTNTYTTGLLASVHRYSRREWLYVSAGSFAS